MRLAHNNDAAFTLRMTLSLVTHYFTHFQIPQPPPMVNLTKQNKFLRVALQMLVYLFYFVPFYVLAIHGLVEDNATWLPDWTILFAGAAAQVYSVQ